MNGQNQNATDDSKYANTLSQHEYAHGVEQAVSREQRPRSDDSPRRRQATSDGDKTRRGPTRAVEHRAQEE